MKYAVGILMDETFPKYDRIERVLSPDGKNAVTRVLLGEEVVAEFSMRTDTRIQMKTRLDVSFEDAESESDAVKQATDRCDRHVFSAVARPIP